jgi:alkanesulfonate monooxygenase SsuD/methylene tetrahydromethanopterin reductase-like flavin-dependent oxidoreductase (luciferase family)
MTIRTACSKDDAPPGPPGPRLDRRHQRGNRRAGRRPVGDPDLCARRLADAIDGTGVGHILLMAGAGDPAATVENITRLGTEVLPALRS